MTPFVVLLIDADPVDRLALKRALAEAQMRLEVREATDSRTALAALESGEIGCALLDFRLPDMGGLDLLHEIQHRRLEVPVIALTGQGHEELAVELMKAGAVDYLSKDRVTPDRLERSLRHAAAMAEAWRLQRELLEREHAARREAEAANRAKDQFMATLSHELRTPLGAIVGWTHLLNTGGLSQDTAERALQVIARNAGLLSKQIDDLLDVSRINSGTLGLDQKPVDLVAIVQSVVDTLRPAADDKRLDVTTAVIGEPSLVSGDPDRLAQVVTNLLSNAVKFSTEGGRIRVRLAFGAREVAIAVEDEGVGIDAEFLPHVFSPFRQADGTAARRHGGLGLGLSIVERLVSLHGGRATVHSPGRGQGATFTVELPLDRARADTGRRRRLSGADLSGIRVLVVDDDDDALHLLAALLRRHGAHVATADSAASGLERRHDFLPDVLLSDLSMPGKDGFWLIEHIRGEESRRNGDRLPAAAVTALTLDQDRIKALTAGYDLHVPKPVSPDQLADVVARLAGRIPA